MEHRLGEFPGDIGIFSGSSGAELKQSGSLQKCPILQAGPTQRLGKTVGICNPTIVSALTTI